MPAQHHDDKLEDPSTQAGQENGQISDAGERPVREKERTPPPTDEPQATGKGKSAHDGAGNERLSSSDEKKKNQRASDRDTRAGPATEEVSKHL